MATASRKHIFIVGPGGVGKTTAGRLTAADLNWVFIDLDDEFMSSVGHIGPYIKTRGYEEYVVENSKLCRELVEKHERQNFLMVLSSGFLVTDVLPAVVDQNRAYIKAQGRTILLLPSLDENEAEDIVVTRQMSRGFNLDESKERAKFRERFRGYQEVTSELIISAGTAFETAQKIKHLVDCRF